jgi:nitroimidazol reductase NimA-like FMN-containing flavoprotein (pyridoxamine 5'-phosphate oxidase superfamily)
VRRKEKEIQDRDLLEQVIARAQVCRLGLCRDGQPYVVPVSFGYDGEFIYFHTARQGMKLDYIAANNRVCFELEHDIRVVPAPENACDWSMSFYSVIGFGTVHEITEGGQRARALNRIMAHYSGREWELDAATLARTRVWRIAIEQVTGKRSKDKTAIQV